MRARRAALGLLLAGGLGLASLALAALATPPPAPPAPAPGPDAAANTALVQRGAYLGEVGDCAGCHTRPGGASLSGGLPLNTPFGVIYSANITPDEKTGIGGWTEADFWRTMSQGRDDQNHNLYPAMPYPYYTHVSRADAGAIFAWLRSLPPARYDPPANRLPFPFSIRALVTFWDWLYLKKGPIGADPKLDSEQARGRQIVWGLGHCGACHTPKTFLGGDKYREALQGGLLDNWYAPDLAGDAPAGLASWSAADIVEFLKTGRNVRSSASGSMSEVVADSTSKMSDADLQAIAAYLKSLPGPRPQRARAPDRRAMASGQAIFVDECSACHRMDGRGVGRFFPPLSGDALLQSRDPTTLDRYILTGTRAVATDAAPTGLAMPAFAWKLDDRQIADVATYARNSWGNHAAPVSPGQVKSLRGKVASRPMRKPSAAF